MRKGSHFPEGAKQLLREQRRGIRSNTGRTHFKKGSTPWNKGVAMSEEIRQKLSLSKRGQIGHFKGGISYDKKEYAKKYRETHRDKYNFYEISRRSKKIANGGMHNFGEWQNLKAQHNWTCPSCKRKEPEIRLGEDHIIPVSKGGSNNIENIQPLCKNCNCKKHDNTTKF